MREPTPILVAEDSDDDFVLLRRAMRDAAMENPVLRFRDGTELVKFLEQIPPAEMGAMADRTWLLLLDITMPLMNGFEVLAWLAKHKGLPKIQTVMLSGIYRTADIDRALALGAMDYLVKPATAELLRALTSPKLANAPRG
ncbi:MAG: response regulator [Opitutaceae bacterium]